MLIWWLLVCVSAVCQDTALAGNLEDALTVRIEWKYLDYDYASDQDRQDAIQSGAYNRSNINPIDLDCWHGIIFVTTVRAPGVPSTLNTISNNTGPGGPLLAPYPDWSWTISNNCTGIISVYRIAIDECDKLWVLDNGVNGTTRICPAKLLVFDLHTSTLVEQITIPDDIAINSTTGKGLLVTPVIHNLDSSCNNTYVYIADARGNALIIYDGSSFRRVTSSAFDYNPDRLTYSILGQNFSLPDGPVGMDLSLTTQNLYFSPMASYNLDYVDTQQLRSLPGDQVQYHVYTEILNTQATAKVVSSGGSLFFGLVSSLAIGCWNEFRELNETNIVLVAQNNVTLQCPSGLKIINNDLGEEELIVFSNRFQKFATNTMDFNDYNYRILTGKVNDLINGTLCEPPSAV